MWSMGDIYGTTHQSIRGAGLMPPSARISARTRRYPTVDPHLTLRAALDQRRSRSLAMWVIWISSVPA
jgi:hypothetical protein